MTSTDEPGPKVSVRSFSDTHRFKDLVGFRQLYFGAWFIAIWVVATRKGVSLDVPGILFVLLMLGLFHLPFATVELAGSHLVVRTWFNRRVLDLQGRRVEGLQVSWPQRILSFLLLHEVLALDRHVLASRYGLRVQGDATDFELTLKNRQQAEALRETLEAFGSLQAQAKVADERR
jgi:hypothetical protein